MIDPRDISVGNWVIKITGTDIHNRSFFEYKAIAPNEYFSTFANACFPIEITPAILGSCGFKHEFGDWYRNVAAEDTDEGVSFLRFKQKEDAWYIRDIKLPVQPLYLHQLQNIVYVLLQEELPVSLGAFKNNNSVGPINFHVNPLRKRAVTRELL
ncbi:MAG: hypothetical protein ACXVBN_13150 [Flavisolibacter sp.]